MTFAALFHAGFLTSPPPPAWARDGTTAASTEGTAPTKATAAGVCPDSPASGKQRHLMPITTFCDEHGVAKYLHIFDHLCSLYLQVKMSLCFCLNKTKLSLRLHIWTEKLLQTVRALNIVVFSRT